MEIDQTPWRQKRWSDISERCSQVSLMQEFSQLRFMTCGSVDDGTSTLIGRLLIDAGAIFEDQYAAVAAQSHDGFDYSLLLDGLSAEREQKITIDVAYRYFSTNRRSFVVADSPGHEQFTQN